ncbi:hypothetical protein L4D21_10140 [Photobacterium profundum]|uniref:hypothetical protein n=1 Tax=Photobacterium profundum TaxID=74109 RepID=UPI003D0996EC
MVSVCLRELNRRLVGPESDFDYHLFREDIIDILTKAIEEHNDWRIAIELDENKDIINNNDDREQLIQEMISETRLAQEIFDKLRKHGWIEAYSDPGRTRTAYRLSNAGLNHSIPFVSNDDIHIPAQNTSSTLAHLQAYLRSVERGTNHVVELMHAVKLSQDIIKDFTLIIAEVEEHRRQLLKTIELRDPNQSRLNGIALINYLSLCFERDIKPKFSIESVERFRTEILDCLRKINDWSDDVKIVQEKELRNQFNHLWKGPNYSLLNWAVKQIKHRLRTACDAKQPELRKLINQFIKRTNSLANHIRMLEEGRERGGYTINELCTAIEERVERAPQEAQAIIDALVEDIPELAIELVNPGQILYRDNTDISENTLEIEPNQVRTEAETLAIERMQALAQLTSLPFEVLVDAVERRLDNHGKLQCSNLDINCFEDLLLALHAPVLATTNKVVHYRLEVLDEIATQPGITGPDWILFKEDA